MMVPASTMATEFSCNDAASFYYTSMMYSKLVSAVSGACAQDLTQPACGAFLNALKDNGADLDKAKIGSTSEYFRFLNDECPEQFPADAGKF